MRVIVSALLALVLQGCTSLRPFDETADAGVVHPLDAFDPGVDAPRDMDAGQRDDAASHDAGVNADTFDARLVVDIDAAPDAGMGPDRDTGPSVVLDGGRDAGRDAGMDAGSCGGAADAGRDAGIDGGTGAGRDAGRDSGIDAAAVPDAAIDAGAIPDAPGLDVGRDANCGPRPETCDNQDEDCDGVIDNGLSITCWVGVGGCARPGVRVCAAGEYGVCDAIPGAPSLETCNGIDDDCNGTVDDGVPLAGTCSSGVGGCVRSGAFTCAGGGYSLCSVGPATSQGLTCDAAIDLGDVPDTHATRTVTGDAIGRDVWYSFRAIDVPDTTCDEFNVGVHLTDGAAEHEISVVRGTCAGSACLAGEYTDFNYAFDFRGDRAGTPSGQCPCWTGVPVDGVAPCSDDSSTFFVRVRRRACAPTPCPTFTLTITNGVD